MRFSAAKTGTLVMLLFDQRERVEAAGEDVGRGVAREAPPLARHVFNSIERDRIAHEASVDEDARQSRLVGRIEAQLDELLAEISAHLEQAPAPLHGAVLADEALGAVEEDLVELDAAGHGSERIDLCKHMLARGATRGVVHAGVVLGAEPGPVLGVELRERQG